MNQKITLEEILALMSTAGIIMMEEGSLVEVEVPIKVVGDIHGQYEVSRLMMTFLISKLLSRKCML